MFDTMTLTKAVGAVCGTFLVFLLGGFFAEQVYHVGSSHGGHGDDHHEVKAAYVIELPDADHGDEEEEPEIDFSVLMASASAEDGEGEFKACRSCHKVEDGANGVGPHLFGVVGREVGSVDGFGYSGNLVAVAQTWGVDELNAFLENPKGYAPGTKMNYKGMRDPQDRANLIAWLDSLDD